MNPLKHPIKKETFWFLLVVLIVNLALIWPVAGFSQGTTTVIPHAVPNVASGAFNLVTKTQIDQQDHHGMAATNKDPHTNQPSVLSLPPPANDGCSAGLNPPHVLSPNVSCTNGSTSQATTQAGELFGCFAPTPAKSVWYSFIATQTAMWISIKPSGAIVCSQNFGISVYRYSGACPPTALSGCSNYQVYSAQYVYNNLELTGLTPGTTYLVQVTQNPGCPNNPASTQQFCIKVGTYLNCSTCASPCGPICTFAGYTTSPSPATVVSTCPGYPLGPPMNVFDVQTNCYTFTAPNDTVNMQQVVYAYCNPQTLSFTYSLYTAGCGLIQSGNVFANNQITGLVPGTTYKICYTLQASCSWDSLIYPYLYTTASSLPVELLRFEAKSMKNQVLVSWSTASEINNKEFILERTRNASVFEEVARIEGAGNTTTVHHYVMPDASPYDGMNFYRLRQIDFDGTEHTTRLVHVNFDGDAPSISVAPNPATDYSIVKYYAEKNSVTLIALSDLKGKVVESRSIINSQSNFHEFSLDLTRLQPGMYLLKIVSNAETANARLVVR